MQEKQHNLEPFQSKIFTWMHSINRKWFFFIDAAELFSEMDPTNIKYKDNVNIRNFYLRGFRKTEESAVATKMRLNNSSIPMKKMKQDFIKVFTNYNI